MDAQDVLSGPITPDIFQIRESYRIKDNIRRMVAAREKGLELAKFEGRDGVIHALDQCLEESRAKELAATYLLCDIFMFAWDLWIETEGQPRTEKTNSSRLGKLEERAKELGIDPFKKPTECPKQ